MISTPPRNDVSEAGSAWLCHCYYDGGNGTSNVYGIHGQTVA